MSSGDDSVGVQKRATTEVGTVLLQTDNEGEFACSSSSSTDDVAVAILRKIGLHRVLRSGDRSCDTNGGNRKSDEEVLDLHSEEYRRVLNTRDWKRSENREEKRLLLLA